MPRTLVSVLAGGLLSLGVARPAAAQSWIEYSEIGSNFAALEASYPDLCARYDLGLSVEGRHLWALRISDNVLVEEDEPEFKYISTMHGNEILGATLCMMLIDHLLNNYGTDGQATNIVDETELWIVPLMNPDGYDRSPRSRYNAHGVDLNRNFPEYGEPNTTSGREIETQHIMNWSFGRSFTCSANLHTGSLVANYPLDNDDPGSQYTPDEDLFIHISEEYSRYNLPMWNSPYFYHGITNGADWYMIWGGMQDWNYHFMGNTEVTLELSDVHNLPASPDRRARACDRRSPRPAAGRDGHGRRA
jgi:carboxypeptidase D